MLIVCQRKSSFSIVDVEETILKFKLFDAEKSTLIKLHEPNQNIQEIIHTGRNTITFTFESFEDLIFIIHKTLSYSDARCAYSSYHA